MDCFLERLRQTYFSQSKTRIHLPVIRYMNSVFFYLFYELYTPMYPAVHVQYKEAAGRVCHERIPFLLCSTPFGF
jgi:hypothetical protein